MENPFKAFVKVAGIASLSALSMQELPAQSVSKLKNEPLPFAIKTIETKKDQNMPAGFRRDQVTIVDNMGKEKPGASIIYFDSTTHAEFITKVQHPEVFSPAINYQKANEAAKQNGIDETVVAFAGAYESAKTPGTIEGKAIENGTEVGGDFSKTGFVYINPHGHMDMYRYTKDATTGKFNDQTAVDELVRRAKTDHGSLFQQLPAIWEGIERLSASSPMKAKYRAICQTQDGKQFVLNCTEPLTFKDFLVFALNLKDANGGQLVYDLMMTDTGEYSEGMFRDNTQIQNKNTFSSYPMVDGNMKNNKAGYTNVVAIGTASTKNALPPMPTAPVQQTVPTTQPFPTQETTYPGTQTQKDTSTDTYYKEVPTRQDIPDNQNYEKPRRDNRQGSQYIPHPDQDTYPGSGGPTYPGSRNPNGAGPKTGQNIVHP